MASYSYSPVTGATNAIPRDLHMPITSTTTNYIDTSTPDTQVLVFADILNLLRELLRRVNSINTNLTKFDTIEVNLNKVDDMNRKFEESVEQFNKSKLDMDRNFLKNGEYYQRNNTSYIKCGIINRYIHHKKMISKPKIKYP